jgi:hypothetical protein
MKLLIPGRLSGPSDLKETMINKEQKPLFPIPFSGKSGGPFTNYRNPPDEMPRGSCSIGGAVGSAQAYVKTLQQRLRNLIREREVLEMDLSEQDEIEEVQEAIDRTRRQLEGFQLSTSPGKEQP